MKKPGFFQRRILDPIVQLLKQGITPEKLAITMSVGIALSTLPILGTGTISCTLAALAFRLNLPAIQLANWLAYPLQLALLIPFYRLGEILFQAPHVPLTPSQLQQMFKADFWGSVQDLWSTAWHGATAWALVAIIFVPLFSTALTPLFRRMPIHRHA